MGYLDSNVALSETGLTVTILGQPHAACVLSQPLVDPTGARMRA
jgi:hypothetical protein